MELLKLAATRVLVPGAVASEIEAYGEADPTALALRNTDWLESVDLDAVPLEVARWDLGRGETEVLAWALAHPGAEAVVDDLGARRCAATLGIPVRGTVGLVLFAKKLGQLPAARPVLDQLRDAGMYLSDHVMKSALALVDE